MTTPILSLWLLLVWSGKAPYYNIYQQDVPLPQLFWNLQVTPPRPDVAAITTDSLGKWTKVATVRGNWFAIPKQPDDIMHVFRLKSCNYPDEP